jgi:hypothetical protein
VKDAKNAIGGSIVDDFEEVAFRKLDPCYLNTLNYRCQFVLPTPTTVQKKVTALYVLQKATTATTLVSGKRSAPPS